MNRFVNNKSLNFNSIIALLFITCHVSAVELPMLSIEYPLKIHSIEFTHDGSKVLVGDWLCDLSTGEKIREFNVNGAAFSWDDRLLVTGTGILHATLWDVETGEELQTFQAKDTEPLTGPHQYYSFIFTLDNKGFIAAELYGSIHLWDIDKRTVKYLGIGSSLRNLFITNDGLKLIATNKIISLLNFELMEHFNEGTLWLTSNGQRIIYTHDKTITSYDTNSLKILEEFPYEPIYNTEKIYSPDGSYLMVGKNEQSPEPTRLIDLKNQKSLRSFTTSENVKAEEAPVVSLVKFSPNGKLVATVSGNTVYIYDVSDLTSSVKEAEALGR